VTHFFKFYPSRVCAALLIFAFSLTILVVFLLPILVLAKAALVLLLLCALAYYLRRDAWLLLSSSLVAIHLEGRNVTLLTRCGGELSGQILDDSLVTSFLTILNVLPQEKSRARSVLIFPDSMDAERSRELRVLLKWGG
jgi:hypothetical protein